MRKTHEIYPQIISKNLLFPGDPEGKITQGEKPMNNRVPVKVDNAPAPVGPYSQAIRCGAMVFVSGRVALDPATGQLIGEDAASQARKALQNLQAILEGAGTGLGSVVKTTIFLNDMADFKAVNEVYAEFFPAFPPARTTVQVAALPLGARVEIEAIAIGQS
jgi:2-iminobutanoate/2-iminopropanoate deaminase